MNVVEPKPKLKVISLANHKRQRQSSEPITPENACELVTFGFCFNSDLNEKK